jgi:hypothetical protein
VALVEYGQYNNAEYQGNNWHPELEIRQNSGSRALPFHSAFLRKAANGLV